jgi:hypothetical protein
MQKKQSPTPKTESRFDDLMRAVVRVRPEKKKTKRQARRT